MQVELYDRYVFLQFLYLIVYVEYESNTSPRYECTTLQKLFSITRYECMPIQMLSSIAIPISRSYIVFLRQHFRGHFFFPTKFQRDFVCKIEGGFNFWWKWRTIKLKGISFKGVGKKKYGKNLKGFLL